MAKFVVRATVKGKRKIVGTFKTRRGANKKADMINGRTKGKADASVRQE